MKITIVGRQLNVRDDQRAMVEKKLAKFDKFFGDEASATVTFSCKRNNKTLEVTISDASMIYRAEAEEETFQIALDRTMEAIERQLRKNKTRLEKRLRTGAFYSEYPEEEVEEEAEFRIRTKTFNLKPMSTEEAILQMNLLGHQFFVFVNDATNKTSVVYCRKDGDYGLIEPE
ncbi:MAG: ribosome-associated translation inhibitor RaiA [Clostridia bacterium]|nr:ribosome-associated translation inhibitor RaiA [Oscillospiraceae bacterium]MBR7184162.1 ribosome-associated translation inhibitor RaiA [Clostridia bacterium]